MKKTIFILGLLLIAVSIKAQENKNTYLNYKQPAFGLYGGLNFNQHTVDFAKLPGTFDCCTQYDKGSGMGFAFGALYSMPLADFLMFDIRLGYFTRDGLFTADEEIVLNYQGNAVDGIFEHSIDAGLGSIALEPILGFKLYEGLKFNIGVNLGYVMSKTYTIKETIKSPVDGTFENDQRERLVQTGDIQDAQSMSIAPLAGLSWDIPLDKRQEWYIAPEVAYYLGLTDVLNDYKWKVNTLKAGLAVKYSPWDDEILEEPTLDEPKIYPYLQGSIRAVGLSADSIEKPVLQFVVEEFLSTEMKPLLTYVFFDDNSSELRPVYAQLSPEQTTNFTEKGISKINTLDVYYNVLNVIGKRMQEYPDSKINIEGCNSDRDKEKGNLNLSKSRAQTVFNYLNTVWNIDESRMSMTDRNLPQEPSNPTDKDGIQENRRVEITANRYEIIAPVMVEDTFRTVNPPVARFYPEVITEAGVKEWEMDASQNNMLVTQFKGENEVPKYVEWKFERDQSAIPKTAYGLDYRLVVTDNSGQKKQTEMQTLPIDLVSVQKKRQERVKDKYIDRYSLILFSFDKSGLSYYNEKLTEFIKSRSQSNSIVNIKGHTDRMGNNAYNLQLSKDRAQSVANAFKEYETNVDGYGELDLIYDNDLPEGRFYSRKVDVVVETPVN